MDIFAISILAVSGYIGQVMGLSAASFYGKWLFRRADLFTQCMAAGWR